MSKRSTKLRSIRDEVSAKHAKACESIWKKQEERDNLAVQLTALDEAISWLDEFEGSEEQLSLPMEHAHEWGLEVRDEIGAHSLRTCVTCDAHEYGEPATNEDGTLLLDESGAEILIWKPVDSGMEAYMASSELAMYGLPWSALPEERKKFWNDYAATIAVEPVAEQLEMPAGLPGEESLGEPSITNPVLSRAIEAVCAKD